MRILHDVEGTTLYSGIWRADKFRAAQDGHAFRKNLNAIQKVVLKYWILPLRRVDPLISPSDSTNRKMMLLYLRVVFL